MIDSAEFRILIDSREQLAYSFDGFDVPTEVSGLKTGDYSLLGYESEVGVERKKPMDFLGCCGSSRARFERELKRAADYQFFAVVVEAPIDQILSGVFRTKVHPASIMGSVLAWEQRFGIHFWFVPDRVFAERLTFKILKRFYDDDQDGKRSTQLAEVNQGGTR